MSKSGKHHWEVFKWIWGDVKNGLFVPHFKYVKNKPRDFMDLRG